MINNSIKIYILKRRILLFAAILFVGICFVQAQPVKKHGKLSVNGTALTDEHGDTVVLSGVSYGWHNWWPRFYNKETVKWLVDDWNCTVVRAAMGVEPKKGYLDSPEWSKEKIEAVIEGAIENDIYVIIDWHSHGLQMKGALEFFEEMAKKYGKYPHIIYEIYNEPDHQSWDEVKAYSIEVVSKIREFDPDNIILIGTPHWDQDLHLAADDPLEGFSNLMYTLHFYAATHKQQLRDRGDYAMQKGLAVFVSECAGMSANGNGPIDYDEWNNWIEWMQKNKISWVCWSVADKNETCSMLYESAGSKGGWTENDLKESGIKTRELLRTGKLTRNSE
ncbi:MAG: glycoside hydrolase family 5 protein [Bacteroidales bacterium]|nr:glycoside hydrolase family 5 protein [Bacteroidales bacterium]